MEVSADGGGDSVLFLERSFNLIKTKSPKALSESHQREFQDLLLVQPFKTRDSEKIEDDYLLHSLF